MSDQFQMFNPETSEDIPNATSSLASESGPTLSDSPDGLTTDPGSDSQRNGGRTDLTLREAEGRTADGRDSATGNGADSDQRGRDAGIGEATTFTEQDFAGLSSEPCSRDHSLGSGDVREWRGPGWLDPLQARSASEAGATRGFWADCDWWYGRDGKYRPIGPGLFPLAHGAAARVLRLRGYGDAINPWTAKAFIEAYLES